MQTKTNYLKEIKKSLNSNENPDELITKVKNSEAKEETEGKGKIKRQDFDV